MVAVARRSYASGNFEFQIDGHQPTSYIKSIDGGWSRGYQEEDGSHLVTKIEIEPITVELGMVTPCMLQWIQNAWSRSTNQRRNGQITYADARMRTMFEHEFTSALLTNVTFPALDGASKESGYMTCTLQPDEVSTHTWPWPGPRITAGERATKYKGLTPLQKMWSPSAFRFTIDDERLKEDLLYVNRLESFTVTTDLIKLEMGSRRLAEREPIRCNFPHITGTLSMRYAESMIQWHRDYLRNSDGAGTPDDKSVKTGAIEFLTPDRKQTLFSIKLQRLRMIHVNAVKPVAGSDQIQRLKFELSVGEMSLHGSPVLGFV